MVTLPIMNWHLAFDRYANDLPEDFVLNYPFKTLCLFIKLLLFSFIIISLWVDIYFTVCF